MELDVSAFACLAALTLVNGKSQPTPNKIFNKYQFINQQVGLARYALDLLPLNLLLILPVTVDDYWNKGCRSLLKCMLVF